MGNCSSLTDNLITGGIMGAAVVAGVATGGLGAVVVGVAASETVARTTGHGVSPFDVAKNNCGGHVEKSAIINSFHQIISYSIYKGVQNCSNQVVSRQLVSIGCYPDPSVIYEENEVCKACYEDNFKGMLLHHQLQRDLLSTNPTILLPINKEYETLMYKLSLCGLRHCKACVLTNTTQSSILGSSDRAITVDCLSQMTNTIQFATDFSATLNQVLTENVDVLNAVAQAVGGADPVNKVTQEVVSRTTQIVNQDFLSQVLSRIQNVQTITLRMSDGIINGNTQESVYNSISQQVTENSLATQILSDQLLTTLTTILNQQTSLSSIGDMIYEPIKFTVSTISIAAKYILYGCLVIIALLIILIVSWLATKIKGDNLHIEVRAE